MKTKTPRYTARACATALASMAVVLVTRPANAGTTYYYYGNGYEEIRTDTICPDFACGGVGHVPNPNAAADAALFGTNLTGSVTFDFDTTGVSGIFDKFGGHITTIQFTVGTKTSAIFINGLTSITLNDGAITDWLISGTGACPDFSDAPQAGSCAINSSDMSITSTAVQGDFVYPITSHSTFLAHTSSPGTWSLTPGAPLAPAPIIGAGLPGLLLAALGLFGWRRRRA